MSAQSAPHLRVVDQNGEIHEACPNCQELQNQLDGAEKDIRAWRARYAALRRDKSREAKQHELFPQALRAFEHWQKACNHPRSSFTPDRFWQVLPFLEDEKYGFEIVIRAIDGAAYDPFVTHRKNGSAKRHDDWELVLRNAGKVEEFANRAPANWMMPRHLVDESEESA